MDIILLAMVAIFLIWKLRSVLNKEQSFISSSEKTNHKVMLTNVSISNVKSSQPKQEELINFFEEQKKYLEEKNHNSYRQFLNIQPNVSVYELNKGLEEIYENLLFALEKKDMVVENFIINPALKDRLTKQILKSNCSIHLSAVNSIKVQEINIMPKSVQIIGKIEAMQIIYKLDEEGNVTEGSKITPVKVCDIIEIERTKSSSVWALNSIRSAP